MKTFEEFRNEIFEALKSKPWWSRDGQFVFNYLDEMGFARHIQFVEKIDCFYDDTQIDAFINAAYELYRKSIKIIKYEFTWCDYLTPCPHNNDIMIGSYECESCKHCQKNVIIKAGEPGDYISKGIGEVECLHN